MRLREIVDLENADCYTGARKLGGTGTIHGIG